jgi:hypothetical protein
MLGRVKKGERERTSQVGKMGEVQMEKGRRGERAHFTTPEKQSQFFRLYPIRNASCNRLQLLFKYMLHLQLDYVRGKPEPVIHDFGPEVSIEHERQPSPTHLTTRPITTNPSHHGQDQAEQKGVRVDSQASSGRRGRSGH